MITKAVDDTYHLLRLFDTPGVGPARLRSILTWLDERSIQLSDFVQDRHSLKEVLTPKQVLAMESNADKVLDTWHDLGKSNVHVLSVRDEDYPPLLRFRLQDKAPPLLFVMGNRQLLSFPSVGFCGSRRASDKGLSVASDCADQLGRRRINVLSGYAAGVDLAVHQAALEAGGTTTLVLAEGILRFRLKRALKDVWDLGRVAIVSEFVPGVPWSVHNAMQRNLTICGMSLAMVLIEARKSGGSMAAGKTALELGVPLFAAVYEGMPEPAEGNYQLLTEGARKLQKSKATGKANIKPVLRVMDRGNPPENLVTVNAVRSFGDEQLRAL